MHLISGVIALTMVVVLAGGLTYIKRKQRAARKLHAWKTRSAILQEIATCTQKSDLDLKKLLKAKFTPEELAPFQKEIDEALVKINDWHARSVSANAKLSSLIDTWRSRRQTKELVLAGKEVLTYLRGNSSYYLTDIPTHQPIINQIAAEMPRLLGQYYDDLLASAETDGATFVELSSLIEESRREYGWMRLNTLPPLPVPDNWHAIVNQHVENPGIDVFFYIDAYAEGSIRLMAARAVVEEDAAEAKFLLALGQCKNHYQIARELTPQMCDELAKVVERSHIQRKTRPSKQ